MQRGEVRGGDLGAATEAVGVARTPFPSTKRARNPSVQLRK